MVNHLWEEWSIVVDILEVDLNVGISDQSVSAVVLSEHSEAPLRSAARFVAIERLEKINFIIIVTIIKNYLQRTYFIF